MGLILQYEEGQTPLDDDEKEGLLIKTIATRGELDEFEQQNIEQAMLWAVSRSFKVQQVFEEKFICKVHQHMYGNIWRWAGIFRKTNKNIGVDKWQVAVELKYLLDDTQFWIVNDTYPPDEIAIRFKHRLVSIHCFPNGNGRHSRLMADIIVDKLFRRPVFTWGSANLSGGTNLREQYLKAIRIADAGNIGPLLAFARS